MILAAWSKKLPVGSLSLASRMAGHANNGLHYAAGDADGLESRREVRCEGGHMSTWGSLANQVRTALYVEAWPLQFVGVPQWFQPATAPREQVEGPGRKSFATG